MAKKKNKPLSTRAYFKLLFTHNPDWLADKNNEAPLAQWVKDHPKEELTNNIKSSMSNIKSELRKGQGTSTPRKSSPSRQAPVAKGNLKHLELLEEKLDDVLMLARQHDEAAFSNLIKHIKQARTSVVLQLAKSDR